MSPSVKHPEESDLFDPHREGPEPVILSITIRSKPGRQIDIGTFIDSHANITFALTTRDRGSDHPIAPTVATGLGIEGLLNPMAGVQE